PFPTRRSSDLSPPQPKSVGSARRLRPGAAVHAWTIRRAAHFLVAPRRSSRRDGLRHVFLGQIEGSKLRTHCIRPLDVNWREDDLTVLCLDLEILRRFHGAGDALGQRELVLGG